MNCGSALLRELDDNFCSDLVIHLIPRDLNDPIRRPIVVNTRQQGFVYHTINCFESLGGSVVIDAFVSNLNPARESAQFELGDVHPVFDDIGDAYRFEVFLPREASYQTQRFGAVSRYQTPAQVNVKSKLVTVQLDSSIDFHCVDPRLQGQMYTRWYMISHRRERNVDGSINKVISTLSAFKVDPPLDDLLNFDPNSTLEFYTDSTMWSDSAKVYLRTPLYVPGRVSNDDRIMCWCYEESNGTLEASLLVFTTSLELVKRVKLNQPIPYSVHSWIALREN